jgi:outer membrane lipoprotein SlyB
LNGDRGFLPDVGRRGWNRIAAARLSVHVASTKHSEEEFAAMKTIATLFAVAALTLAANAADAKGCIKGAVVGGVAGHYAGHHGVVGAIAGCAYGRHRAKEQARQQQDGQKDPQPGQAPSGQRM